MTEEVLPTPEMQVFTVTLGPNITEAFNAALFHAAGATPDEARRLAKDRTFEKQPVQSVLRETE